MASGFNAYNNFYTQELQGLRDNIDRRIQQYQQSQNQMMQQQQQPQIQQTFQLSNPNQNITDFDGKYAENIDDVKNVLVFKSTLFLNKDMNKLWVKDTGGNIRTFNLQEEIQVDENMTEINNLKQEINELKALLIQNVSKSNNLDEIEEQKELGKIQTNTKVVKKK